MKETHERSILAIVLAVQVLSHCTHEPTRSGDVLPEETEDEDANTDLPVVSATCTTNGCLRWLYLYGDYPRSELESIIPSAIEIQNGYSVWYMGFMTDGHEAAATVTIPYGVTPPDEGWPVVLNNPGTVGIADDCAVSRSTAGSGLAGLFGARGVIGTSIDYPGIGTPGTHPYLVAQIEGRAALDAARATRQLAARAGLPTNDRVAMVGLSQGGHATIAAAAEHTAYAPELDIRGFAVAGPASVFPNHWTAYVSYDGPHLVYHALLVYAWSKHYEHTGLPIWQSDVEAQIDEIMETHCLYDPDSDSLGDVLGTTAGAIFHEDFLAAYAAGDFSSYPFMATGFATNSLKAYEQSAPLRIYQGTDDDVVLSTDTQELVDLLRNGGVQVDLVEVAGGGHTDVAFGYLTDVQLRTEESIEWVMNQLRQ